jgi:enoyl-CoA hydratase/carnithine racemase
MLYEGALLDPAEALRIGLVEGLSEDAAGEAERIARRITDNAPASVAQLKRIVTRADSVDEGNAGFDRLMGSDALREGLRAFREKRAPRF